MEILAFEPSMGRPVQAHGSTGVTAQGLIRSATTAVTVLHIAAGGEVGRHPAVVDQLLTVTKGRGAVQAGDGPWEDVAAGTAVLWRAGEDHVTRAFEDIVAVVVEAAAGL